MGFPLLRAMMMKGMKINAEGARRSAAKIDAVFADVEAMLADGRPYLLGDRLSGADLTFAALAAPLLLPAGYGALLPALSALPAEAQAVLGAYIQRPAGAFALRLYADHRRPAAG
jgi:glutathione S-transferase